MTRIDPETASPSDQTRLIAGAEALIPRVIAIGWRLTERFVNAAKWVSEDGITVILATEIVDGELWAHLSYSRVDRIPSWEDGKRVKDVFLGPKRKALIVLPPDAEYFNLHPNCLHMFCSLDRDPLPDFRTACGQL